MRFFTPLQLKKAMFSQRNKMETLGKKLDAYVPGSSLSGDFLAACERQDSETLNKALTEAVSSLLGTENIPSGLEAYCRKCGIDVSLAGLSDMDKIRRVTEHRTDIRSRLDREGA